MNIADRIQGLRKIKGISQEELADAIGVSRQAVSKWESEQSIPDLDKIILLSEFFAVTTDYILKGIEAPRQAEEKKAHASVFVAVATALNFIGLLLAAALWYEQQSAMSLVAGLVFMVLGCMIACVGMVTSNAQTRPMARYHFWTINIWILAFLPLSFFYNMLMSGTSAPYPLLVSPLISFAAFWLVYFALCLCVVLITVKRTRQRMK